MALTVTAPSIALAPGSTGETDTLVLTWKTNSGEISHSEYNIVRGELDSDCAQLAIDAAACSNAALIGVSRVVNFIVKGGVPVDAEYSGTGDRLVTQYQRGKLKFDSRIPAPLRSIFDTAEDKTLTGNTPYSTFKAKLEGIATYSGDVSGTHFDPSEFHNSYHLDTKGNKRFFR